MVKSLYSTWSAHLLRRVFAEVKKKWGVMFLKAGQEKQNNNYTHSKLLSILCLGVYSSLVPRPPPRF